ncbi:MAG: hypothetical protein A4S14_05675 [Proteobacteria bacterium SG_bin9]|nr:MAG: hypothetical protein A4S14_05675 [Proteobacteria bacterium SG_bin9]
MSIPPHEYRAIITTEVAHPKEVADFFRFRKWLFIDRCGWRLPFTAAGERDQFDGADTEYCLLYDRDRLIGGFRAIRTDFPYLAEGVFPELATVRPFPRTPLAWEISRFGVLSGNNDRTAAKLNYALMFKFAALKRATCLVAIADLTYERFLAMLGVQTSRYGPPQEIGRNAFGEPLMAVAGEISLHAQDPARMSYFADIANNLEITDATHVLGRPLVSA